MCVGKPKRTEGRTYLSFSFPLLSSIFGSLIPPDTYRYIPLSAFEELIFEIKLNPFAFYTSGFEDFSVASASFYSDSIHIGSVADQATALAGPAVQLKRAWTISKLEINCDILSF